jgi:hypothetical protein
MPYCGDKIGLFNGVKAPLVIRLKGQRWELIGDSYVHSLMNEEAFEQDKCERMWFV